jgi:hypothetical protein
LIFLDDFVHENGESFMDVVPSEVAQAIPAQAKATDEGWEVNPIPTHLLGVRDPHDVAWVDAQCTPQAIATLTNASSSQAMLTGNLKHIQDIAYVVSDRMSPESPGQSRTGESQRLENMDHP